MSKCKQCEELKNKINIARTENIKFTLDTKNLIAHYSGKLERLKQTLTEIKELLLKTPTDSPMHCVNAKSVILQKISEVE